ncbi:MAG TPA: hypothetical protein ENG03_04285 [Thioploca sp.]|nr:hypothetical protein [Thioploca sp.]
MSQLRTNIEDYIQSLQTLKAQCLDETAFLDAAEDKWGVQDPRFIILQQRPKQQRWISPSGQPEPEVPKSEQEPNELIDWLPGYLERLQALLKKAADDNALVEAAAEGWGQGSYEHQVVVQASIKH